MISFVILKQSFTLKYFKKSQYFTAAKSVNTRNTSELEQYYSFYSSEISDFRTFAEYDPWMYLSDSWCLVIPIKAFKIGRKSEFLNWCQGSRHLEWNEPFWSAASPKADRGLGLSEVQKFVLFRRHCKERFLPVDTEKTFP